MDMVRRIARKTGKRYFMWYPKIVSNNPKKVIAAVIIFSIFMGFFAMGMEMDTSEDSFTPDIPKEKYLSQIRETFGRAEETVQVAFIAHDGDVFTVGVLQDMLDMEEAIQYDPAVNHTLAGTNEISSGINTLATNILMADQALLLEEFIVERSQETEHNLRMIENQTKMYLHMNSSLSMNVFLLQHHDPGLLNGALTHLVSMSYIMTNPRSWVVVHGYQEKFYELIGVLHSHMDHANVSTYISYWLLDMQQHMTGSPELGPFLDLVQGTNDILESPEAGAHEKQMAREMTLSFFVVGEHMSALEGSHPEDLNDRIPSLELSLEQKREKLGRMSDHDVKETVSAVIHYEPSRLNENVSMGTNNFEMMDAEASVVLDHLHDMNSTLTAVISGLEPPASDIVADYHHAVVENQTVIMRSKAVFSQTKEMFQGALNLGPLVDRMGDSIVFTVSKDFSPTEDIGTIAAESSLGIIFMNSSLKGEVRLEAQRRVIELGDEVCQYSETKVFANQVMMDEINESADRSLKTLLPIAFVVVVIILLIVYRSFTETFLSLSALGLAILWTFGIAVLLGYEFNPLIVAVPVLITGLVIDYGIHMVMRYREEKEDGRGYKGATFIAIATVGGALILTTFTTVVGFLSNTLSNIRVMQQFGILAGVGISFSFILMTAYLPATLMLIDDKRKSSDRSGRRSKAKIEKHGGDLISGILSKSADASDRHPWVVLAVVTVITVSALYGVVNIDTTFDIQDFLPEGQPQSENIQYIAGNFEVSTSYAYILTEGRLDTPEYLRALEHTTLNIRDSEMVGGDRGDVVSPLSVIQTYGNAPPGSPNHNSTIIGAYRASDLNGDGVPDENITYLYDLLYQFQGSSSAIRSVLYRTPEGEYSQGIIRLTEDSKSLTTDLDNAAILERELERDVIPLRDAGYTAKITSGYMIAQETTEELTNTQLRSLIFTIIIVGVALAVVFYHLHKSMLLGVITTAPVALVTLWIVGTMYVLGVSLNVMTVSITALTVGMGVDYSIHITHRFVEEISDSDLYGAMSETVQKTGAGLFGSAATTVAAFAIISTSEILPMSQFGFITAIAISYSFFAAVFVLPSALMLWAKYRH